MINAKQWMEIPREVREKIIEVFKVPKSGTSIVESNAVKDDGRTDSDLVTITADKMRDYLGIQSNDIRTTTDELFKQVIAVIQGVKVPKFEEPLSIIQPTEKAPIIENIVKEDGFKCDICGYLGKNKKALTMHKTKKHK